MFNWLKRKKLVHKELYPGVPTTDGTNDFLLVYSNTNKKNLLKLLNIYKQQVVEKAIELTVAEFNSYQYILIIADIKHLSYNIKAIEILLRLSK